MECPHCSRSFAALNRGKCPHCARPLETAKEGMVKTSQVRVAAGEEDRVFRSLDDLPPDLRRQLRRALNGPLVDTIIIADPAGRQRIFEAIRGLPPHLQKKVMSAIQVTEKPSRPPLSRWVKVVVGAILLLALAVLVARLWV